MRNVDRVVYLHPGQRGQLICTRSNLSQDFERSNFLVIQFLQWSCTVDIAWQKPHHIR